MVCETCTYGACLLRLLYNYNFVVGNLLEVGNLLLYMSCFVSCGIFVATQYTSDTQLHIICSNQIPERFPKMWTVYIPYHLPIERETNGSGVLLI